MWSRRNPVEELSPKKSYCVRSLNGVIAIFQRGDDGYCLSRGQLWVDVESRIPGNSAYSPIIKRSELFENVGVLVRDKNPRRGIARAEIEHTDSSPDLVQIFLGTQSSKGVLPNRGRML